VSLGTVLRRVYDERGCDAMFESTGDEAREFRIKHSLVEHASSDRPDSVLAQLVQQRILLVLIHVSDIFDIHSDDHPRRRSGLDVSLDVKSAKQDTG
jgi:hypothetical protein